MADEPGQNEPAPEEQPAKKRQKEPLEVREQRLAPKPSVWPFILALTLVIAFIGVMISPIILVIGAFLTVAAIIGWMLEKH
ncbi:MAG TPA: cytochrome c oxidase subunit 4 [Ktedonobacteraceae bacterium]